MWVIPTFERPHFLREMMLECVRTGISTPGVVVVNGSARDSYAGIELPPGWTFEFLPRNLGLCGALNWAFQKFPDEPWYGYLGDDMQPKTEAWDAKLIERLSPTGIVSSNDNWQAENGRITGWAIGGDLLRTIGYWFPKGLWHNYSDDFWEMIGTDFQNWTFCRDIVVETLSPFKGDMAQDDASVLAYSRQRQDKAAFETWKREEKQEAYKRILALIGESPTTRAVNVGGRSVFIATPCAGGNISSRYLQSYRLTLQTFWQCGVASDLWTLGNESLVMRARNIAIKSFLMTECTDLLFIDADMGWEAEAVMRLIASGKDCVAVAGPRKQHPLSFCTLLDGPPIHTCPETGMVRAAYVGTGMMLLSRACVQKMWEAYPETAYQDGDSNTEYRALFDTEVREGRYWSEDYTWCERWRSIGGEVWVDQSQALEHVGEFIYKGALQQSFIAQPMAQAAE